MNELKTTESFRVGYVDLLRGVIMIIMAIDHVRVFSGVLPGGPSAGVFFTRWITHFCAPGFAFFAGMSAFLYFQKSNNHKDLAWFLLTRGLLLVLLEVTVVRFLWTFNFDYANFVHTNIIWALGWSMIIFAAFVKVKPVYILFIGLAVIFGQKSFSYFPNLFPESIQEQAANWWSFIYPSAQATKPTQSLLPGFMLPTMFGISILYTILPWVGIVMVGYGLAEILKRNDKQLKKICLWSGIAAIVAFLAFSIFYAISNEASIPFAFKVLNQQKYPPSPFFVLMTIGPLVTLIPAANNAKGWLADAVRTFGRVPMFYYLLHLLVIHLAAFAVNLVVSGDFHHEWYRIAPFVLVEENQRWGLPLLYAVWTVVLVPLYYACKAYAKYKTEHPDKAWLKYL